MFWSALCKLNNWITEEISHEVFVPLQSVPWEWKSGGRCQTAVQLQLFLLYWSQVTPSAWKTAKRPQHSCCLHCCSTELDRAWDGKGIKKWVCATHPSSCLLRIICSSLPAHSSLSVLPQTSQWEGRTRLQLRILTCPCSLHACCLPKDMGASARSLHPLFSLFSAFNFPSSAWGPSAASSSCRGWERLVGPYPGCPCPYLFWGRLIRNN